MDLEDKETLRDIAGVEKKGNRGEKLPGEVTRAAPRGTRWLVPRSREAGARPLMGETEKQGNDPAPFIKSTR